MDDFSLKNTNNCSWVFLVYWGPFSFFSFCCFHEKIADVPPFFFSWGVRPLARCRRRRRRRRHCPRPRPRHCRHCRHCHHYYFHRCCFPQVGHNLPFLSCTECDLWPPIVGIPLIPRNVDLHWWFSIVCLLPSPIVWMSMSGSLFSTKHDNVLKNIKMLSRDVWVGWGLSFCFFF